MNVKMKVIRNICAVLVLLAAWHAVWSGQPAPEEKILQEWDFSQGLGAFYSEEYAEGASSFSWEETGGLDDSSCVRIESTQNNDARYVMNLEVLPDTYYRISAWIRTEDVPQGSNLVGGNISVLNTFHYAGNLCGSSDWTKVELYGCTGADQNVISVCLRLGFYSGDNMGVAWFDDLEVQQLSKKPSGVEVVSFKNAFKSSSHYEEENVYWDTMKIGALISVVAVFAFVIMYRYGRLRDVQRLEKLFLEERKRISLPACVGILIALGLILRLILSVTAPQCSIDVGLFKYWGQRCVEDGIPSFYSHAEQYNLDYPPLYIYFLWFQTLIAQALGLIGTAGHTLLIKLPSILADGVIAFILYKLCDRRMSRNWILFVLSLWLFNPMVLLDCAAWGQVESLQALPIVLMVYFIIRKRFLPASVALGFAVLLKPQGIFLVPILGFAWLRRFIRDKESPKLRQIGSMFGCIGAFLGTSVLIALPFGIRQKPNFFSWLINLYIGTANGYKGATVNSYNFYYLLGENWTDDGTVWMMGLTFFQWGMLFIVAVCLLAGVLYLTGRIDAGSPFLIASMTVYGVTMFGPRMHERYFFPCLLLLLVAVLYTNNKFMLWLYGGISAVNFLSVLSVMMGLEVGGALQNAGASSSLYGWYYWAGEAVHRQLIAGFNLLCCFVLIFITIYYVMGNRDIRSARNQIWKLEEPLYEELSLFE